MDSPFTPRLEPIEISAIEVDDRRFDLRGGPLPRALLDSIRRQGVIEPPLIWNASPRAIVILGHRRVGAAIEARLETIPARIAPESTDPLTLLHLAVEAAAGEDRLTWRTRGRALRAFESLAPDADVESRFLPMLGLPARQGLLETLRPWARLPGDLEQALDEGAVSESVALSLATMPAEDRRALIHAARTLRLGVNVQKELIEHAPELSRREGGGVREIIHSLLSQATQSAPADDLPARVRAFRDTLRRCRYPRMKAAEERFREIAKSLHLPDDCALQPPPSFEGSQWTCRIGFDDVDDLSKRLREAADRLDEGDSLREFLQRGE